MATAARRLQAAVSSVEEDPRWAMVRGRSASADLPFVYAVKTTGVYARPGARGRLPKPENVEFFESACAAEAAGYRPNKRVARAGANTAERYRDLVVQACRQMDEGSIAANLGTLARRAGLSPFHFHRIFKSVTGLTPKEYARAHRARAVRAELGRGASVTAAIHAAGYSSSSRFYETADAVLGMTPRRFRALGDGMEIYFAVGQCSLGSVLVAQSAKGICAIHLGDDPQTLVEALQQRFANARLIGADAEFERRIAAIVTCIDTPATGVDLPLDVRGTAFQMRVWQALRAIPLGATATYAQIAAQIGQPRAVRAVAAACAANPVAVLIPCHRVVRNDGKLAGYRWGVARKSALLQREACAAGHPPLVE